METMETVLHLTKMAGGTYETNDDISKILDKIIEDPQTKIIFFCAAIVDFDGTIQPLPWLDNTNFQPGKYGTRLKTSDGPRTITLTPTEKIIKKIRRTRKDIFLVGFKQTCGLTEDQQYIEGLNLCKKTSCNLVLANDTKTRTNIIITPEEARYHTTTDRQQALYNLVEMTKLRSHLTFTRSTVIDGTPINWNSHEIPETLRTIINWCIKEGAYKPFNGVTVGHFACKLNNQTFLTSIRRTNFNNIHETGLVKIKTDSPDSVIAYGAKPSVGGQSQRIIFHQHQNYDCIVHFHCPIKENSKVPTVSQREFECGSHECGQNTSNNLKQFGNLSAVYLNNHGPNIVFNQSINPQEVIEFIKANFELSQKTGGYTNQQKISNGQ